MLPETFTPSFLRQLEMLKIRTRRHFLGAREGGHVSLKRGHGIEFSEYRKYELGDNPRHIDWGVYARSDKLYVKRFQEEQDISIMILVDTSFSMFATPADGKWTTSINLALALAYLALMQQDTVCIACPGNVETPFSRGVKAIHTLGSALLSIEPRGSDNLIEGIRKSVSRIRFPGVLIFLSDLLIPFSELEVIFNMIRSKNLEITAIQVLGASDLNPLEGLNDAVAIDSETGQEVVVELSQDTRVEYGRRLADHNETIREFLAECRIGYASIVAGDDGDVSQFVVNDLPKIGLLR